MSDAEIDVDMPDEQFMPNQQPEDPLLSVPVSEGVNDMPLAEQEAEEEDSKVDMKIKEIVPDNEVFNGADDQAPPKRKKRPVSEKQKAHLAKIRVKALEAKKAKKANKPPVKSAKKQYEEEIEDEYGQVNDVPKESALYSLSRQELQQLQFDAIYGYDTIRKDRKQKKREAQAKQQHEQQTFQAVSRAVNRPVDDDGWGVCFQ